MKTEVPAISVIIPVYNKVRYVQQAIDSVLNQTFKDVNVIVVDDCSTDGSYELVRSAYGNEPRVVLMRNEQNQGSALTRNTGIRSAVSKYIALLDADDVFLPNMLEALHTAAESHNAEIVSSAGWLFSQGEDIPKDFSGQFVPGFDGIPAQQITVLTPPPR